MDLAIIFLIQCINSKEGWNLPINIQGGIFRVGSLSWQVKKASDVHIRKAGSHFSFDLFIWQCFSFTQPSLAPFPTLLLEPHYKEIKEVWIMSKTRLTWQLCCSPAELLLRLLKLFLNTTLVILGWISLFLKHFPCIRFFWSDF